MPLSCIKRFTVIDTSSYAYNCPEKAPDGTHYQVLVDYVDYEGGKGRRVVALLDLPIDVLICIMKFRKHKGKAESLTENMFACLLVYDSEAEEDQELREWIKDKKVNVRHFQHKTKGGKSKKSTNETCACTKREATVIGIRDGVGQSSEVACTQHNIDYMYANHNHVRSFSD